jgi:ubiquinone/menaquinone biosynthesis C-methylase UbiE
MEKEVHKGYEEHLLGDYRNFWWNKEFLDLMAGRLEMERYRRLLDVGCGLCHWSRLLVEYLAKPAEIFGVDNNKQWTKGNAAAEAYFNLHQASLELVDADAQSLPFEDGSFDIVTCQTLLIHLKDPALALREMKRVLRPGGMILCAEPNNRVQALVKSSFSANDSIDEILDHVKYALICERGRKKLGLGDSSLGDLLPGMLAQEGFRNIAVKLSDKAIAM